MAACVAGEIRFGMVKKETKKRAALAAPSPGPSLLARSS